jgi:hypothetical protein
MEPPPREPPPAPPDGRDIVGPRLEPPRGDIVGPRPRGCTIPRSREARDVVPGFTNPLRLRGSIALCLTCARSRGITKREPLPKVRLMPANRLYPYDREM